MAFVTLLNSTVDCGTGWQPVEYSGTLLWLCMPSFLWFLYAHSTVTVFMVDARWIGLIGYSDCSGPRLQHDMLHAYRAAHLQHCSTAQVPNATAGCAEGCNRCAVLCTVHCTPSW